MVIEKKEINYLKTLKVGVEKEAENHWRNRVSNEVALRRYGEGSDQIIRK